MKIRDFEIIENRNESFKNYKPEKCITFYKAMQYRWENSADPEIDNVSYHSNPNEAIEAADSIGLNIGFTAIVEKVTVPTDVLEEDFEMEDIDNYKEYAAESEEYYCGDTNEGNSIVGAIIVEWSYERYVGYARNLKQIGIAGNWPFSEFKVESDLISGNEERTFHSNYSILLYPDEIEGVVGDELHVLIEERLNERHWKWNYFKNNPHSAVILESIKEICK